MQSKDLLGIILEQIELNHTQYEARQLKLIEQVTMLTTSQSYNSAPVHVNSSPSKEKKLHLDLLSNQQQLKLLLQNEKDILGFITRELL